MGAIAERLRGGLSTGAEVILLTRFEIDGEEWKEIGTGKVALVVTPETGAAQVIACDEVLRLKSDTAWTLPPESHPLTDAVCITVNGVLWGLQMDPGNDLLFLQAIEEAKKNLQEE